MCCCCNNVQVQEAQLMAGTLAAEVEAKAQQASQKLQALQELTEQLKDLETSKAALEQQSAEKASRLARMEGTPSIAQSNLAVTTYVIGGN